MSDDITQLLRQWRNGELKALDRLIERMYPDLKKIALGYMRKESQGHTLQATAVVNEAYVRLYSTQVEWKDRVHFLCIASNIMRRILVDHAKRNLREKRGGGALQVTFSEDVALFKQDQCDVIVLDDALAELSGFDERGAKIIEMKVFSGMTMEEIAGGLGVSIATAERNLKSVRAWLYSRLFVD